jgi:aspartate/methionine/tyrosine aminotransferase
VDLTLAAAGCALHFTSLNLACHPEFSMSDLDPSSSVSLPREAVRALRSSQIREVANAGFGVPDVLPFWFGESDRVTPPFIREAAAEALGRGDTFYTHNLGVAPLRESLARYVSELHGATPRLCV